MMSFLYFLLFSSPAFACGPDFCGRPTACGEYVANVSPIDSHYFVSDCNGALPHLDPSNYTEQNIDIFLRDAFGYEPGDAANKSLRDSYPDPCLYAQSADAMKFFSDLLDSEKLKPEPRQALTELRANLNADCREKKKTEDFAKRLEPLDAEIKRSHAFSYLQAAAAFYLQDFPASRKAFRELAAGPDASLAELGLYMDARGALNEAQVGWNGYDLSKVSKAPALDEAAKLFAKYLEKYPEGKYAASARGLVRRVKRLQRDDAGYALLLNQAISALDGGKAADLDQLYLRLWEFNTNVDWKKTDPATLHPFLWVIRSYYSQRGAPTFGDDAPWTKEERDAELPLLLKSEKNFAHYPTLFPFVKANLLYGAGKFAEAQAILGKISDKDFLLKMSLAALKANVEAKLGHFAKARELLAAYMGAHPAPPAKDDAHPAPSLNALYTYTFLWEQNLGAAFAPAESPRVDADELETLARKILSTAELQKIFDGADDAAKTKIGALLVARRVYRREFTAALATLNAAPKAFPDDDLKVLRTALETLAKSPRDPAALLHLADLVVGGGSPRPGKLPDADLVTQCKPEKLEKLDWPIHFYQSVIDSFPANKTSDVEREALMKAISCFQTKSESNCYDTATESGIPKSARKRWFQTLKKKYGKTDEVKELRFYW